MASSDKKPSLAMVVEMAKAKKGDDAETPMDDESEESSESYDAAVDEFLDAQESGDREAAKSAFKAAVMACR